MDRKRGAGVLVAIGTFMVIHACQIENVTPVVVSTVTVEPGEASVTEGNGLQFTATVLDDLDESLSGAVVEWTSEDRSIIAVEPDGSALALSAGSTVVHATYDGVTGSSAVTVLPSFECKKPPKKPKGKRKPGHDHGNGHGDGDDDGDDGDDDDDDDDDDDGDDDDGDDDDDDGGHGNHHHNGGGDDDGDDDNGGGHGHDGDDDDDGGHDDNGDDENEDQPGEDDEDDEDGGEPRCVAPDGLGASLEPVAVVGDPR